MTITRPRHELPSRRLIPFLVGTALANAGDMFTQIAIFWTGLSLSGQAISLAGLGGVWTLSMAFMGLISGPIIDRFNRRDTLFWLHGGLALLSLGLFALAQTGQLAMWHLWAFLIGESVFGVPSDLAFGSILPDLVKKDRLVRINGLLSSWGMTDNLIEAAASGVVLALWGPAPIFLLNGIMYLFGSAAALVVPRTVGESGMKRDVERWHPWADLRLAGRYVLRERLLRRYILLGQFGNLIFAPLFFMAPLVSIAIGMGSEGYGFLQSLTLGGVLAGSLLASSVGTKWPKVPMWLGGQALYAGGFLVLGIFVNPLVAFVAFFLFGLGCTGDRVYAATLFQQLLPSRHRGRVFGITRFADGVFQPLALSLAMLCVDQTGVGVVLLGLAVLMLGITALEILMLPLREEHWTLSEPPSP